MFFEAPNTTNTPLSHFLIFQNKNKKKIIIYIYIYKLQYLKKDDKQLVKNICIKKKTNKSSIKNKTKKRSSKDGKNKRG